ncbi:MAG: DUF420 domain-containing protein [Sulfurovum sp.]
MDYMFQTGFLGTKAPFFMDFVLIIVALLPFLLAVAISFAIRGKYRLHEISQKIIFVVSVLVVGYFEYGIRLGGGYDGFVKDTTVSHDYSLIVLIVHIVIAIISFILWAKTIFTAKTDTQEKHIGNSTAHSKSGKRAFIGVTLTSLSGIWVYLILFVY